MALKFVIIPVYFIEKGLSVELAGIIIGIVGIPMAIKFVFGGIVDYYCVHGRKKFIILGGLLIILCLFAIIFLDPSIALIPFTVFLFLSVCGFGFLDVSSDAWAIEIGHDNELGKINRSMFAGQYAGMAIGSSVLAFIAKFYGYPMAFFAGGVIVFLIILFPLAIKDTKKRVKPTKMTNLLFKEFKKKSTQILASFALIFDINKGLLMIVIPLYMKLSLNLDIAQIGLIVSIFPIVSVIGSLFGGAIADIWTRKKALYIFIWMSIVFSASLIFADI
jgi:MFS family permease